jgi:hypothetical protein
VVHEYVTSTRRHLALLRVGHTACGLSIEGSGIKGRVSFPWRADDPPRCKTCRRVLHSGGLGFWVTARGRVLTEWDIANLAAEAEAGYERLPNGSWRAVSPVQDIQRGPGPDAMHWWPEDEEPWSKLNDARKKVRTNPPEAGPTSS